MKTPAERQAAKRQRRKDAGETLVQVWVPADKLEAVKAAIAAAIMDQIKAAMADVEKAAQNDRS